MNPAWAELPSCCAVSTAPAPRAATAAASKSCERSRHVIGRGGGCVLRRTHRTAPAASTQRPAGDGGSDTKAQGAGPACRMRAHYTGNSS